MIGPRAAPSRRAYTGRAAPHLLILGCGFTGIEIARRAVGEGQRVVATTRQSERRDAIERLGVELHVASALTAELVQGLVAPGAHVVVAFPPDARTDAEITPALATAGHVVYVSTTGVYGARRGHIDETTPVDPTEPRARDRLAAEERYRGVGATVVRAAGIYGAGRGLHQRLKSGAFRIPGDGTNVVSRIHVADLARLIMGLFRGAPETRPSSSDVYVASDDAPVPQIEVIEWLCRRMDVPVPPRVPIDAAPATLRHDRAIDNRRIKSRAGVSLLYPSYREGFEACLAEESLNPPGFAVPPVGTPPGSRPRSE